MGLKRREAKLRPFCPALFIPLASRECAPPRSLLCVRRTTAGNSTLIPLSLSSTPSSGPLVRALARKTTPLTWIPPFGNHYDEISTPSQQRFEHAPFLSYNFEDVTSMNLRAPQDDSPLSTPPQIHFFVPFFDRNAWEHAKVPVEFLSLSTSPFVLCPSKMPSSNDFLAQKYCTSWQ